MRVSRWNGHKHHILRFKNWQLTSAHFCLFKPRLQQLQSIFKFWLKTAWFFTFGRKFPSAPVSKLGPHPRHAHQHAPRSMETPVLLNGQMLPLSHIQTDIHQRTHKLTVQSKRRGCVQVRARLSDCYKQHTQPRVSRGLSADSEALWTESSFVYPERQ